MNPSDKLTIETPEQITLELPLAGIGSRALAFAFDMLLQFAAIILLIIAAALISAAFLLIFRPILPQSLPVSSVYMGLYFILAAISLLHLGYFIFFEIRRNGQTPGKKKLQIRVIKESGRPITAMEAVARNLLRLIDGIGSYAAGLICMVLSRQHKRLGDYAAGTLVVYDKNPGYGGAIWNMKNASSEAVSAPAGISAKELTLVEAWLNRRTELTTDVRLNTANKIASAIRKRTGIEPEDGQSVEDFLELLARRTRGAAGYRS